MLSSGAFTKDNKDVTFPLNNTGTELVVAEKWPDWFVSMEYLGRIEEEEDIKEIGYIERAIKEKMLDMRPTSDDPIKSILKLQLPFQVQPTITSSEFKFIGSKSGTRVLYMNLKKADISSYNNGAVNKELEIIQRIT
ncbi:hypothetical protein ACA910_015594 [Epithemia clementina (nom. ined.)]